jgi:hypothetical protein
MTTTADAIAGYIKVSTNKKEMMIDETHVNVFKFGSIFFVFSPEFGEEGV